MKFAKTVLAAAAMALACGAAFAADNDNKHHKGFNDMDKNADGKLTRAEAKGNKELLARWKEADSNNDGFLTRTEYLALMAKREGEFTAEDAVALMSDVMPALEPWDGPANAAMD